MMQNDKIINYNVDSELSINQFKTHSFTLIENYILDRIDGFISYLI